jgi:sucrose-6-phosphate hydrolase SacC (GH32 family)
MVITSSILGEPEATDGAISYAESDDLIHWEYKGTLYHPGDVGSPECPEVFALGRRWYLVVSFFKPGWGVGRTSYRVAGSPLGPYAASTPESVDGMDLCAGNSGTDGRRRILWAWVPTYAGPEESRRQEWGGDLCLPRELYPLPDGSLGVRLPADVGKAIRGDRLFSADALPASRALPISGGALDLALTLHLQDGSDGTRVAGVAVRSATGKADLWIGVDAVRRELTVRRAGDSGPVFARLPLPASLPNDLPLRLVLDGDIAEAFLADRYALACRLPETSEGAHLSPVADGPARFTEITAYALTGSGTPG